MILRLANAAARLTLVFVALALAIALAYSSIRNAIAVHYSSVGTRTANERATQLEPGNPLNWFLLGRYWQYNLDEPDIPRAIKAYRTSLSLDPRSADTWLDIATAYELEADLPAARDAFLQAKRVYPVSAEVSWRYGNFLLRQGEIPLAFAEIRHAVSVDPNRAAEAFSRCWRVDPDIQAIVDNVLPASGPIYLAAIHELIADAEIGPALAVWARLVALHPSLHLNDVIPFTDMLLFARRPDDARRVWYEAVALSDTPSGNGPTDSVLWDGGFESGITGGGFTWVFAIPSSGVQVSLDSKEKHSGRQSLQLGFDGKHNVNFADVCNLSVVQPATSYRFSAWVRTQALSTDQGIRFRLSWVENSRGSSVDTPETHGTQPWTKIEMPWTAGADVRQVRVCVSRDPSAVYGSRIRGTAWVDDVALIPEPAEHAKP
jgi:tetratricopeptide (TPR) repeat protein